MHLISSEKNSIEQLVIALSAESCASVALVVQESIHLVNGKNIQVTEPKKWKHSVKVKSTTTNGKMVSVFMNDERSYGQYEHHYYCVFDWICFCFSRPR
ncbi:hypothetical protein AAZX31_04G146600 [Glycine max]